MSYSIEQRDADIAGSTAQITYRFDFHKASRQLVHVTMRVENCSGSTIAFVMPSWAPGSYKIRDYAGWQGNVRAYVSSGQSRTVANMRWTNKARLEVDISDATTVELDYVLYCNERTVRTNHVNRFHAFIMPVASCMYVEGRQNEVHHVELLHDQGAWPNVSTALSPVKAAQPKSVLLGARNYDVLADSPIEIGDHIVERFLVDGVPHELAIASNQKYDASWLVSQIKTIVATETKIFGGFPYDRYVFIIHAYPGIYGGLEHARSSVNAVDPSTLLDSAKCNQLLALLCHEYFHLWNVKRIRPIELGPFDYTHEAFTPMLWLAEGLTSYYDNLIAYRCGFHTKESYIKALAQDNLSKLDRVPGRKQMSVRDSSYLAWLKLYLQSPDGTNRFPSYYLKGGIIFLLLDLFVIDHSDGKKSLDDGLRAMWQRYLSTPNVGITESECIALIERGTGVQCKNMVMEWLDGTADLPYNAMLELVGLRFSSETTAMKPTTFGQDRAFADIPAKLWCGWQLRDDAGKVVVKAVEDGSPADVAGIGIDDEILAVNGRRCTSVNLLDQYLAESRGAAVELTAHCDGRLYQASIAPTALPAFVITDVPTVSKRQAAMREFWLRR